jgi:hypothetical protein
MQKLDKSKLVMGLARKEKLVPHLDKALKTFDEPFSFEYKPKETDNAWHPSGSCTPTALELYTSANEYLDAVEANEEPPEKAISPSLRKSFMVGHYWHQLLQYIIVNKLEFATPEAVERVGKRVWLGHQDVTVSGPAIPISGTFKPIPFGWATGSGDVAPLVLPSGWEGIMDIKTMRSSAFKATAVPFADKYECQINIYMDFFDQDHGMILGINKDSPHDFKEILYERNQPLIDTIYAKWEFVSQCIEISTEPVEVDDKGEPTNLFPLPLLGPAVTA